jgi:hypothetical protein
MASEGYQYMVQTCPQLQAELLQVSFCAGFCVPCDFGAACVESLFGW